MKNKQGVTICAGTLYYDPVRFKCDDGTMYYYITNYTLKEVNK